MAAPRRLMPTVTSAFESIGSEGSPRGSARSEDLTRPVSATRRGPSVPSTRTTPARAPGAIDHRHRAEKAQSADVLLAQIAKADACLADITSLGVMNPRAHGGVRSGRDCPLIPAHSKHYLNGNSRPVRPQTTPADPRKEPPHLSDAAMSPASRSGCEAALPPPPPGRFSPPAALPPRRPAPAGSPVRG